MRHVRLVVLSAYCFVLSAQPSFAQVPHTIRYQGTATDSAGVPLEGPYTVTCRLYDAATAGTKLWEEATPNVAMAQGRFAVTLGAVTPLNVPFDRNYWVSIEINQDGEMTPRQKLSSVPYAMRAATLDDPTQLVQSGSIILWSGGSCPASYTRLAALDGKFLAGGGTYNPDAGGIDTQSVTLTVGNLPPHTHPTPDHSHPVQADNAVGTTASPSGSLIRLTNPNSYGYGPWGNGVLTFDSRMIPISGGGTSGSTGSGTAFTFDNRPAFATVLLCQKD